MERARKPKGRTMEGTHERASMVPITNRSASGANWEKLKGVAGNTIKHENEGGHLAKKTHHDRPKGRHLANLLGMAKKSQMNTVTAEKHTESQKGLTKVIAMDCEMVGIGDGSESIIARVSIVNRHGYCVYDKYVKPREEVTDYRTQVSGILPHHIDGGEDFDVVQKEVADILKQRLLVGHGLRHDLAVLYLSHPHKFMRDTSKFKPFKTLAQGRSPSLKKLAMELLGREIQIGEHSSVEDARAAMQLYILYKNKWESEFYSRSGHGDQGHVPSQKPLSKKSSKVVN